jgi:hypothetical protein
MKIKLITCIFLLFSFNICYSYDEIVHMWITYQAYDLLKKQGVCYPDFENFIGSIN